MEVTIERDVAMTTRDGVQLLSDVYHPADGSKCPTLVVRTPYDKSWETYANGVPTLHLAHARFFPQHGYTVVMQDTRGRYASGGEFYPYASEAEDGFDTIEWAASLPWSNGKVAFAGKSYMGLVQYLGASQLPPSLVAAAPMSAPVSHFQNCIWRRGVFELGWQLSYVLGMAKDQAVLDGDTAMIEELNSYLEDPSVRFSRLKDSAYRHLPLRDWIERFAVAAPYFGDLMDHDIDGPFWQDLDVRPVAGKLQTPMMHVGSWCDPFLVETTEMYNRIRAEASDEVAAAQKMVIGPWAHEYGVQTAGELDFGAEATESMSELELRWFDYWLKGIDNGIMDEPAVRVFVMGRNTWRHTSAWPPPEAEAKEMFLSSDGNAATTGGRLSFDGPGEGEPDQYMYDPNDPVPTCGGTTLLALGGAAGFKDQREIEARPDVLTYTSDVLDDEIEVTGDVKLTLFASSSARDTDFNVKLVDVHPDGHAYNVADGVVRARFRESLENPTLITPGEVIEYSIDMWSTAHAFLPGHRIRLSVTSSDFPRYDRNPNTGHPFGVDAELIAATQAIFHDAAHPSRLHLPVMPSSTNPTRKEQPNA
jgi:putative CocE/NonD family hydrolase